MEMVPDFRKALDVRDDDYSENEYLDLPAIRKKLSPHCITGNTKNLKIFWIVIKAAAGTMNDAM